MCWLECYLSVRMFWVSVECFMCVSESVSVNCVLCVRVFCVSECFVPSKWCQTTYHGECCINITIGCDR